jgi:hypothetical protein
MTTLPKLCSLLTPPVSPSGSLMALSSMNSNGNTTTKDSLTIPQTLQQLTLQQQQQNSANLYPTHLQHHPVNDWVAYVQHDHGGSQVTNQKAITTAQHPPVYLTVQNTSTGQLISQISLAETAQTLFPAANSKTVAQKLGTVVSVAFYDAAVLNWSGMNVTCASPQSSSSSSHSTGAAARLSCVILQTTSRVLFFILD